MAGGFNNSNGRIWVAVLAVSAAPLVLSSTALAQCRSDADCKGARICRSGECVNPDAPAPSQPDPCAGNTCSSHGSCVVREGRPTCTCQSGYLVDETGLKCILEKTSPPPTPAPVPPASAAATPAPVPPAPAAETPPPPVTTPETAGATPAGATPAGETPGGETPAGETSVGETPADETPPPVAGPETAGETPGGGTPVGEAPPPKASSGPTLQPENEKRKTLKMLGHVSFWTGLGFAAFGGASTAVAKNRGDEYNTRGRSSDKAKSRTWSGLMWAGFGAGAALMTTGLVLRLVKPGERGGESKHLTLAPEIEADGVSLSIRGGF